MLGLPVAGLEGRLLRGYAESLEGKAGGGLLVVERCHV